MSARQLTYQNAVPDSVLERVSFAVLGAKLGAWAKVSGGRMCDTFELNHEQLRDSVTRISEHLNALALGEFEVPLNSEGFPVMSREQYRMDAEIALEQRMAANIACLDKLASIHVKLTAGGLGAVMAAMKSNSAIADNESEQPRNATPRRRFSAGASQLAPAERVDSAVIDV